MNTRNIAFRTLPLAVLLAACSGCVREKVDGSTFAYSVDPIVPASIFLAGLAMAILGYRYRGYDSRITFLTLFGGASLMFLLAPLAYLDKAIISEERLLFSKTFGFDKWEVVFPDLSRIELVSERRTDSNGMETLFHSMVCVRKTGGFEVLPLNGFLTAQMVERLKAKSLEFGIVLADTRIQP